jgi:hypothetical protein
MISYWSRKPSLSDETITSFDEILSKHEELELTYLKAVKQNCEVAEVVEIVTEVVTEIVV